MRKLVLGIMLIFSLACIPLHAATEPTTGHQSESAWVPITLILTSVVIAIIANTSGDMEKGRVVTVEE
jgi:hypothetical protein